MPYLLEIDENMQLESEITAMTVEISRVVPICRFDVQMRIQSQAIIDLQSGMSCNFARS